MNIKYRYFLVALIFFSSFASAISLTSHRIYLDSKQRNTSFIVFNRSDTPEECTASYRYFSFSNDGVMGKEIKDTLPINNTENIVKFSPRRFTVQPGNSQAVRLSLRRGKSNQGGEYHSYLSFNCGKLAPQGDQLVNISARLVHNVPVIARTKLLKASLSFSNVNVVNNKLRFRMNREGERSVYGDITITNKKTGEAINSLRAVSLYIQSRYRDFEFSIPLGLTEKDIGIEFNENKAFGGSLIVTN